MAHSVPPKQTDFDILYIQKTVISPLSSLAWPSSDEDAEDDEVEVELESFPSCLADWARAGSSNKPDDSMSDQNQPRPVLISLE